MSTEDASAGFAKRWTVKSSCPVCGGVLESVLVKCGVKAMVVCIHCATLVVVDVEVEAGEAGEEQPPKLRTQIIPANCL